MSKERPILFSEPMVRAILEGRKTQTRRVVKVQPTSDAQRFGTCVEDTGKKHEGMHHWIDPENTENQTPFFSCPYGKVGDRLWVRETWAEEEHEGKAVYRATDEGHFPIVDGKWKPSIHMPRWASRITLEITAVRVERLKDISEADAQAESVYWDGYYWRGGTHPVKGSDQCWGTPKDAYEAIWKTINGPEIWEANPWVWVIEFKKI